MSSREYLVGDRNKPAKVVENPHDVDNPVLAFFLNYWREGRGDGALPRHGAFRPQQVGTNLPWVTMLDALPGLDDFRYRVVGSRITDYFLTQLTGKTVNFAFANVSVPMGKFVLSLMQTCCRDGIPVRLSGPAIVMNKAYCPDYDSIYLPYAGDGEHADRIVNAFVFNAAKLVGPRDPSRRSLDKPSFHA